MCSYCVLLCVGELRACAYVRRVCARLHCRQHRPTGRRTHARHLSAPRSAAQAHHLAVLETRPRQERTGKATAGLQSTRIRRRRSTDTFGAGGKMLQDVTSCGAGVAYCKTVRVSVQREWGMHGLIEFITSETVRRTLSHLFQYGVCCEKWQGEVCDTRVKIVKCLGCEFF